jgi:hypothetical protein
MTTTPGNASSNLPGKPPVVDLATWQAAREELLVREKAHTREGDAIAAARRRLPMVEFNGAVEVTGVDGPIPFVDLFQGHDELGLQNPWPEASIDSRTFVGLQLERRGNRNRPVNLARNFVLLL